MNVLGIIAEYNPFHNGHQFHIDESKRILKPDVTVAVMSGDFVQRGGAAIIDKWDRSRIAVQNGIDLVVELPFIFACNRAEIFAKGGVEILQRLGAGHLSFGSESGDVQRLMRATEEVVDNGDEIGALRSSLMKEGRSFAASNYIAVKNVLGEEIQALIDEPNNILAMEYLKQIIALDRCGEPVPEPFTVKRRGEGHHGSGGASSIRQMVVEGQADFKHLVPQSSYDVLAKINAAGYDECHKRAFEIVRSDIVKKTTEELTQIYCMGEGLENRMKREVTGCGNLEELIDALVTKRYTRAAIRRILTYLMIGIKSREPERITSVRILASNSRGRELIKKIKKERKDDISLITNVNKIELPDETILQDILAADMYNIMWNRDMYSFSDKVIKPYMDIDFTM